MITRIRLAALALVIFVTGFVAGNVLDGHTTVAAQGAKVFELRTYTTHPGKLPNLEARFRDHTMRIFEKHGMHNVGYWVPQDAPDRDNTLVYIISHDSRQAAERNWKLFREDPEWQEVARASQVDGQIVANVESVFMTATDFSPIE